jgi:hypothetical protein
MTPGVGSIHQTLLLWIARRMQSDGFTVAGFDGVALQAGFWNTLPKPFLLRGRRPDAWGCSCDGLRLAFGEAKTARDILSHRTQDQFRIFGSVRMKASSNPCPLYVAAPREQASVLDEALKRAGMLGVPHLVRIHVPEALLKIIDHAA